MRKGGSDAVAYLQRIPIFFSFLIFSSSLLLVSAHPLQCAMRWAETMVVIL